MSSHTFILYYIILYLTILSILYIILLYYTIPDGRKAKIAMKKNSSSCKVAAIRYVMKLRIRMKMHLAIKMPWTIVLRPGSVRTMSAAALAASVDPVIDR